MSGRPAVSVVIPSHRRADSLRRTLLTLGEQEVRSGCIFEVVVSLDGERDVAVALLEGFEAPYPLRWISRPHRGRAAARNAGAAEARGDLLLERFALRTLLALDRATGVPSAAMVGAARLLERASAAPMRFCNRVFDYLYWHGVDRELRVQGQRGPLARRIEALRSASS